MWQTLLKTYIKMIIIVKKHKISNSTRVTTIMITVIPVMRYIANNRYELMRSEMHFLNIRDPFIA